MESFLPFYMGIGWKLHFGRMGSIDYSPQWFHKYNLRFIVNLNIPCCLWFWSKGTSRLLYLSHYFMMHCSYWPSIFLIIGLYALRAQHPLCGSTLIPKRESNKSLVNGWFSHVNLSLSLLWVDISHSSYGWAHQWIINS